MLLALKMNIVTEFQWVYSVPLTKILDNVLKYTTTANVQIHDSYNLTKLIKLWYSKNRISGKTWTG
jgi:hypothetical protein